MFNMVAPCLFGLEGPTAFELKKIGATDVAAQNGRVCFSGDAAVAARANIRSAFAERICVIVGEADVLSFTELFDAVNAMEWERYIGKADAFPVKGWSLNSELHSIPDCQKIIKKAIVERLRLKYRTQILPETGAKVSIRFSILKNRASLMVDTSGDGLHKRGYRSRSNDAPIKETLAAAMCDLARIYPDTQLYDPFCGSGTILIEAAMRAANIAPGLRRSFAGESLGFLPASYWREERARAEAEINTDIDFHAFGSDIDPAAVKLTVENAAKAGVGKLVSAKICDIKDLKLPQGRATVITNPPYGERMSDLDTARELYRTMGRVFCSDAGKKYFIISPDDDFPKLFDRDESKSRKLYNGMIRCRYYMYF